jgi:hypothetical protein
VSGRRMRVESRKPAFLCAVRKYSYGAHDCIKTDVRSDAAVYRSMCARSLHLRPDELARHRTATREGMTLDLSSLDGSRSGCATMHPQGLMGVKEGLGAPIKVLRASGAFTKTDTPGK